jgi:hypothetical protein
MTELTYEYLKPLKRVKVFTPLGIHFWDPATDSPVSDGLSVTARPVAAAGPIVPAFRTASGVYAFQGLPGLRHHEYPPVRPRSPASPPDAKPRYIIEVTDQGRRFLPIVFTVELPLPYKGIYRPVAGGNSPANSPPRFYLYSAPTRIAAPGLATVRADLVEHDSERPAAHAILEVDIVGEKWYGIADDRGVVAVHFPYPPFVGSLQTSPPETPPVEQEWELAVRVRYDSMLSPAPHAELPDLFDGIWGQQQGGIWPQENGSSATEWSGQLCFDQELVLRTEGLSTLLIEPAATSP